MKKNTMRRMSLLSIDALSIYYLFTERQRSYIGLILKGYHIHTHKTTLILQ